MRREAVLRCGGSLAQWQAVTGWARAQGCHVGRLVGGASEAGNADHC